MDDMPWKVNKNRDEIGMCETLRDAQEFLVRHVETGDYLSRGYRVPLTMKGRGFDYETWTDKIVPSLGLTLAKPDNLYDTILFSIISIGEPDRNELKLAFNAVFYDDE